MVDLSIIIVNYNVAYFLRQCIQSIYDSKTEYSYDIWVVDNNSEDRSVSMIENEFSGVNCIKNQNNLGFSKANNQAIQLAKSRYVLILNPDTLLKNDTIQKSVSFLDKDENVGALGVKMLDGNGNYLPESKRGFPTPWASFCKFSGLGKLFVKSSFFNGYYQGHLDENKTQEVDVLTGAFMLMPTELVQDLKGFDERFFMYGEDIDLSYRIKLANKKNIYFPETSIVHYKGESTKKADFNYVRHFYNAMILFAEKHFSSSKKLGFLSFLKLGIYLSGITSFIRNLFRVQIRFVIDLLALIAGLYYSSNLWAKFKFEDADYYKEVPLLFLILVFSFLWLLVNALFGHYDRKPSFKKYFLGIGFASALCIFVYGLFPESMRFSRAVMVLLIVLGALILFVSKKFWNRLDFKTWQFIPLKANRILIVGALNSAKQVKEIIMRSRPDSKVLGYISPGLEDQDNQFLAELTELNEVRDVHRANEVIFCSKEIPTDQIFYWMSRLSSSCSFKIASKDNSSILGSDSKNRMGNWYTLDVDFRIADQTRKRFKRILDLVVCLVLFFCLPLLIIFAGSQKGWIRSIFKVFIGELTWVSYNRDDPRIKELPTLKNGVFSTAKLSFLELKNQDEIHQLNLYYAKNYAIWQDIEIIWKNLLS